MRNNDYGTLYLCPTPIGNLEDITLRALRILKEVDYIAAEDTRHTLKLLNHYDIKKQLISYHEHNKQDRGSQLIEYLKSGKDVALVSDAGMPGISDPGADLVKEAANEGVPVTVLPGATASITALVLSCLSTDRFVFEGFLPRESKKKKQLVEKLLYEDRTIILYEAPHRLISTLKLLHEILGGNRKISIVRELTKIHEEVIPTDLDGALSHYDEKSPKGEYVLIIEGRANDTNKPEFETLTIEEHLQMYINLGMSKKEAIKQVARDRKLPKNEVYKYTI